MRGIAAWPHDLTLPRQPAHRTRHVEVERIAAGRDVPLTVRAVAGDDPATGELPAGVTAATVVLEVPDPAL